MNIAQGATVLVTGASGAVGPRVVDALCSAGYQVRAFALDALSSGAFPNGVQTVIGDVTDKSAVQAAMQGVDVVIHLAALLHIVNPPPDLRAKYERINVGGTATVVAAAVQAGVKRIVLASTIAVYGPSNGQIINEDSIPHPDTFYARTKLAAEQIVLHAGSADGRLIGTALRFGAVYGARIKGNYQRLLQSLARGKFIPLGAGRNRRTLIYDKDLARAVVLAAQHPLAAGKIYNVTDGQFHTLHAIITAISAALGRRPPWFSIPVTPARLAAGMIEDALRLIGRRAPINRATIDKYTEDIAVEGKRIQKELGFVPQYGLEEGWREVLKTDDSLGEGGRTDLSCAGAASRASSLPQPGSRGQVADRLSRNKRGIKGTTHRAGQNPDHWSQGLPSRDYLKDLNLVF